MLLNKDKDTFEYRVEDWALRVIQAREKESALNVAK